VGLEQISEIPICEWDGLILNILTKMYIDHEKGIGQIIWLFFKLSEWLILSIQDISSFCPYLK
jgi:hypothetical protein